MNPTAARPGTQRWLRRWRPPAAARCQRLHAGDDGAYGVEVILESGRHAEVKLDDFQVIDQVTDDGKGPQPR